MRTNLILVYLFAISVMMAAIVVVAFLDGSRYYGFVLIAIGLIGVVHSRSRAQSR
jgi:hypothetical protein